MNLASFQTPNLAQASEGSRAVAYTFDFTDSTVQVLDLAQTLQMERKLDFVQSVYIDNADNTSRLDLTFIGAPQSQRISCPAFQQGWFPISWPLGSGQIVALGGAGETAKVIFANFWMQAGTWGPSDGTLVVPPLVNVALDALAFAGGDNQQLVAGVAQQNVKLYRGVFSVDQPTTLTWTDGPGGTVLFAAFLTAGGSVDFDGSGVPWFNTAAGNALTLHSSAACNVYGGFGYVVS